MQQQIPSPPADPRSATRPASSAILSSGRATAAHVSNLTRVVIAAAVVAAIVLTVFCAQNTGGSSVKFLLWGWQGAPLFVVILASVGLGIVIGSVFVWLRLARYSAERRILGRRRSTQ